MDTILRLSRGSFTLQEMERMEIDVLQHLQWFVHPPVPQVFLKHLLVVLNIDDRQVYDLANFLIELSVIDYYFVTFQSSEIATAALINAMETLKMTNSNTFDLLKKIKLPQHLFDVQSSNIEECRQRLYFIESQANDQHHYQQQQPPQPQDIQTPSSSNNKQQQVTDHRPISPDSVMNPPV